MFKYFLITCLYRGTRFCPQCFYTVHHLALIPHSVSSPSEVMDSQRDDVNLTVASDEEGVLLEIIPINEAAVLRSVGGHSSPLFTL